MSSWYDHITSVRQEFPCGTGQHDVTWRNGRLRMEAHGTVDAERALQAFGARAPACLDFVDRFVGAVRDPVFLETWARVDRDERTRRQFFGQYVRDSVIREERRLLPLADLDDDMLDRLAYCAVRRSLRRDDAESERRRLITDATFARIRRAVVASLVHAGVRGGVAPLVRIDCAISDEPGLTGVVTETGACALAVEVGGTWLLDVYARGLHVVEGRVVLAAEPMRMRDTYRVRVATWTRQPDGLAAGLADAIVRRGARWEFVPA